MQQPMAPQLLRSPQGRPDTQRNSERDSVGLSCAKREVSPQGSSAGNGVVELSSASALRAFIPPSPNPNPGPAEDRGNFLLGIRPPHFARGPDFPTEQLGSFPPLLPISHNSVRRFALDFRGFELGIGSETLTQWHQGTAGEQPAGSVPHIGGNVAVPP